MSSENKELASQELRMLTEKGEFLPVTVPSQSEQLMSAIISSTANPEVNTDKMREMYTLYSDIEAHEAKKAYFRDMSLMTGEMPVIPRNGTGHNNMKYPLYEDAVKITAPFFTKYGFSFSCPLSFEGTTIKAVGTLSHKGGHSEMTDMVLPSDTSGNKNAVQAIGSTTSYARRYCMFLLANLVASGEDDDGKASGGPVLEIHISKLMAHNNALRENIYSVLAIKDALNMEDYSMAAECMSELDHETVQTPLWLATTKGGIWTTDERSKLKSDQFGAAMREYLGQNNEQ